VDTETPRPEKLVLDFDTTVNPFNNQFVEDRSGRGNDGTPYNGASYSTADKAFTFDGTDDYIKASTGISGNYVHTVSFWLYNTNYNINPFWIGDNTDGKRINCYIRSTQIDYSFRGDTVSVIVTPPINRWYHLTFTYSGTLEISERKIYIDGVEQVTTFTGTAAALNITNDALYIGTNNTQGSDVNGKISNFKIYSVALEPSEVKKLYNLGRTGRSLILADTSLQIGAGLHSSTQEANSGPHATLDVHGSILASGAIHGMQGNFHKMLGYARGGAQVDHHRTDNCLVAMGGMTVNAGSYASAGFIIRKSPANWMPFIVECYHAGNNTNSGSLFGRQAVLYGAINGTSITPSNGSPYSGSSNSGITLSAAARGDEHVLFNVSVNKEGRSYGVMMCRLTYYYGIKGREY
jgi:hypothetical protein